MTLLEKTKKSVLGAIIIIVSTIIFSMYDGVQHEFILDIEHLIFSILSLVVEFMNLIGGFLIHFGSVLLLSRYVRTKLKAPDVPFSGTAPRFTFLTLSLEIFIGAEIINTAVTRTLDDFLLLSLTIATRGLIALILYLEKKACASEK